MGEVAFSKLKAEELLKEAEKRMFFLGKRDLASALSFENMRFGIGKMLYALDDGNVICVFGPDATITRNIGRWNSGFGYGAVIRWSEKGIFFPEMKPNACGMTLVRIDELPSRDEILERIAEVENSELRLDGIRITPDFGKGNHFFEFYKVIEVSPDVEGKIAEDAFYAIIHGSPQERKREIYDMINEGEAIDTPLGKISVLSGSLAKRYYRMWLSYESFSKRRREFLVKEILGKDVKVISNLTHQGLFSEREIRLGCHDTMDKSYPKGKALFPVALRWDCPLYIFKGRENLNEEVMERLDFKRRAEEVGLLDELKSINILPHGGGYDILLPYSRISIKRTLIGNNFILSDEKPIARIEDITRVKEGRLSRFGELVISNPHELPYTYRGESVIREIMEYALGKPVAKLQPLLTIKI